MKIYNGSKVRLQSKNEKKKKIFWIVKISVLAVSLSLLFSFFSQVVLKKNNLFLAILLLFIFMFLNVFSDMIGLAITSCQIGDLKREVEEKKIKENIYRKCLYMIKNSDKVSSILCDVVGDICGILCGVSATILTNLIISNDSLVSLYVFMGAVVSSLIAGLTVFFKAIAKDYAVKNSVSIVKKISAFILIFMNKI